MYLKRKENLNKRIFDLISCKSGLYKNEQFTHFGEDVELIHITEGGRIYIILCSGMFEKDEIHLSEIKFKNANNN